LAPTRSAVVREGAALEVVASPLAFAAFSTEEEERKKRRKKKGNGHFQYPTRQAIPPSQTASSSSSNQRIEKMICPVAAAYLVSLLRNLVVFDNVILLQLNLGWWPSDHPLSCLSLSLFLSVSPVPMQLRSSHWQLRFPFSSFFSVARMSKSPKGKRERKMKKNEEK